MELANVGGVFLLLVMGIFVSILINILQFLFFIKSQADENNVSGRLVGPCIYSIINSLPL